MKSAIPSFERIIKQHAKLLSRVANTYEANVSIQQELFQEICIAIWQSLSSYKGEANIKTYILKVAHNRGVTHVSKEVKQFKTHSKDDAAVLADSSLFHDGASLEADTIRLQNRERLLCAIRDLKLPARQVISLSLEGLSYDEIAEVCGISTSNVGVMIKRTKEQLQKAISNE
jgi:RNA polymerase sigma-70 factor (ECF subfamily)